MKWNWGTGIVVGMLCFIGFIMYFVITMSTDNAYSHDLVTEEYYAKEMAYQTEIDAETNTRNLSKKVLSEKVATGWMLTLPTDFEPAKTTGNVLFYRPSNEKLDFEIPLTGDSNTVLIPAENLVPGRWNIIVSWDYEGTAYMFKQEIVY